MATVNLGAIKFNWKGAYSNSTAYAVDDVVSSGGSSYVCIQAHTNQPVGNATAYWNIMSSAGTNGTNGTDVGTTLTTQGDMLYRDGSGLQRLAKGTANQELRINSGATAPEWHTPAVASSDFTKICGGTFSSASNVQINGSACWGTADEYRMHKLVFYDFQPTASSNLILRQLTSGSEELGGIWSRNLQQFNSSNTNQSNQTSEGASEMYLTFDNLRGASNGGSLINFEITLGNVITNGNTYPLMVTSLISAPNQDGEARFLTHHVGGGVKSDNSANANRTGLMFFANTGNLTGKYCVYGYKA